MEFIDRRVLGAIEFVDAVTAARMRGALRVEPVDERVVVRANRSSLYVIRSAPGLEAHLDQFEDMPATPAFGALEFDIQVRDPVNRYLPRVTRIALPRLDAPANDVRSVLKPIVVPLFPAAAAAVQPGWAVLRVRVQGDGAAHPGLANVLVVATPQTPGVAKVTAMTDARGEALVAIAGVQPVLAQGAAPALLTRSFDCQLALIVDRRVVRAAPDAAPLADPDTIELDRIEGHIDVSLIPQPLVSLSAGKSLRATAEIPWP